MRLTPRLLLSVTALALIAAAPKAAPTAPPVVEEPKPPKGIIGKSDPCMIMRVVDGDTADVQVRDKVERLRLLDMDTEESWPSASKPVTPFGLETSKWAKAFLAAREPCWVEYGPERRDAYDRLLGYLWRREGKAWKMYNLQAVERGFSPYFTKYGYSGEHHAEFVAAEKSAQDGQKGIWAEGAAGLRGKYTGKDGLRAWWDERADSLKAFAAIGAGRPDLIDTRGHYDELRTHAGERVIVFTSIREPVESAGTWAGKCEGRLHENLQIVAEQAGATEKQGATEKALQASVGRYRYFAGRIERAGDRGDLRLVIAEPGDVSTVAPARAARALDAAP